MHRNYAVTNRNRQIFPLAEIVNFHDVEIAPVNSHVYAWKLLKKRFTADC